MFDRSAGLLSTSGRPAHDTVPSVGDVFRISRPGLQVVALALAPVTIQIVSPVGLFPVRPLYCTAMVSIGDMELIDAVGGFQGDGHMPHLACVVVNPEDDIPRPDLIQVLQSPGGVSLVPEDEGADHAGICSTAVDVADTVAEHDALSLCAEDLVFVSARGVPGAPDGIRGPLLFDLPEHLQHVFFSCRFAVGQEPISCTLRSNWPLSDVDAVCDSIIGQLKTQQGTQVSKLDIVAAIDCVSLQLDLLPVHEEFLCGVSGGEVLRCRMGRWHQSGPDQDADG